MSAHDEFFTDLKLYASKLETEKLRRLAIGSAKHDYPCHGCLCCAARAVLWTRRQVAASMGINTARYEA